jgi:outer membrane protein assembly factor BamB
VTWSKWPDDYELGNRAGDLNGDGVTDQLMFRYDNHRRARTSSPVHAVSGHNGRLLWSADIDVRCVAQVVTADIQDLDGDGKPEVVFVAAMDWGYDRVEAPAHDEIHGGQLWLAVLSGQSGSVQWKQPLSAAYGSDMPAGKTPLSFDDVRFDLAYVDLNGDRVLDFVIPAEGKATATLEYRAISGKDGTALWVRPVPADGYPSYRLVNVPPVAIADINADEKPEVIAVEYTSVTGTDGASRTVHVVALDGSNGRAVWDWKTETKAAWGLHNGMAREKKARVKPLVIRSAGQSFVCVKTYQSSADKPVLAVLDSSGQLVHEIPGTGAEITDFHAWPCDVDGDGQDKILVYDRQVGIRMVDPTKQWEVAWSNRREALRFDDIMEVVDGRDGIPGMIMVCRREPNGISVFALDARTGRDRWICKGPRTGFLGMLSFERHFLAGAESDQADPHVVFMYNAVRMCRKAARVDEGANSKRHAETTSLPSVGFDPRLYRPLPWASLELDGVTNPRILLWMSFFSISFIIVPLGAVGWIVWRRQFSLKFLLLLPAVVLLFLLAWHVDSADVDRVLDQRVERLGAALTLVPVVLCAALLVLWGVSGRFRRIGLWLLMALGCIVTAAAVCFLAAPQPLAGGERYLWDGWHVILFPGLYLAACVSVGGLLLFHMGKSIYRKLRGSQA